MVAEFLRMAEEFCAIGLLINAYGRAAVAYHVGQPQPSRNELRRDRPEKSGERRRFVAHEKCAALGRERIFSLSIFFQQAKADERVHDDAQTAFGSAGFGSELPGGLWSAFKRIENLVVNGAADDEWRRVSETKFHQAFRGERFFRVSFLWHI